MDAVLICNLYLLVSVTAASPSHCVQVSDRKCGSFFMTGSQTGILTCSHSGFYLFVPFCCKRWFFEPSINVTYGRRGVVVKKKKKKLSIEAVDFQFLKWKSLWHSIIRCKFGQILYTVCKDITFFFFFIKFWVKYGIVRTNGSSFILSPSLLITGDTGK